MTRNLASTVGPDAVVIDRPVLRQAGVIPYRVVDRRVQVLLVTSRGTGRWIVPKGNVAAGSTALHAAEEEAFEEAGVKGVVDSAVPLGSYTYRKRLGSGDVRPAVVEVYLLRVRKQVKKWREKGQRMLEWVSIEQAVARHGEPGLEPLLDRLLELETMLVLRAEPGKHSAKDDRRLARQPTPPGSALIGEEALGRPEARRQPILERKQPAMD